MLLDGFELDHNAIFDQQIDPKTGIESHAVIFKRNEEFRINAQASARKIACENGMIH
jgi:hypothetical protein